MSWDVILYNISSNITSLDQFDPESPPLLGTKSNVINILKKVFPDISFTDPNWAGVSRPGFSIEFNFGKENLLVLDHLMLHIRGGNEVIESLKALCEITHWRVFDLTTGNFINFENDPTRGLQIWRDFLHKVVALEEIRQSKLVNKSDLTYSMKKNKQWWQFWK
jgi:hypothetical protein